MQQHACSVYSIGVPYWGLPSKFPKFADINIFMQVDCSSLNHLKFLLDAQVAKITVQYA